MPLKKALGPLFSFFCDANPVIKWRAVTAFGTVVKAMAAQNMEAARVAVRRLMWSLNEESGAIGWGAPEAMAECMAQNAALAQEYHRMLISYAQEPEGCDGNYLEHVPLLRGVYWGLARLAEVNPKLVRKAMPALWAGLDQDDPQIRGLAIWALGLLGDQQAINALQAHRGDAREIDVFRNRTLQRITLDELAREALQRISAG